MKRDPELVFRRGLTVSRSTRFPWRKREEVFPRIFPSQRSRTGTSALIKKEKDQGWSGDITLQGGETVPNHVTDFFTTIILKGNLYNPGNLDINVSKL